MKILDQETLKTEFEIEIWPEKQLYAFQKKLLNWYDEHQRELPWRKNKNPYRIWISEIMLQQTRVETVIPYFNHFMEKFPTVQDLANSSENEVLKSWEGLGYYSRARNLRTAAQQVMTMYNGTIPSTFDELIQLKGIGPYTAGAISSMAFNQRVPAVDGNVMRVVSRLFEINLDIKRAKNFKVFFSVAYHLLDEKRPGDFNQALMDLGSMIMTPKAARPDLSPVKEYDLSYLNDSWTEYPVVTKAKSAKVIHKWGLAIQNKRGEFLLEQRPNQGLLANMWTFPLISENQLQKTKTGKIEKKFQNSLSVNENLLKKLVNEFYQLYGLKITIDRETRYEIEHIFSHRIWKIVLLEAYTEDDKTPDCCSWVLPDNFNQYVFPTVQSKLVEPLSNATQMSLFNS